MNFPYVSLSLCVSVCLFLSPSHTHTYKHTLTLTAELIFLLPSSLCNYIHLSISTDTGFNPHLGPSHASLVTLHRKLISVFINLRISLSSWSSFTKLTSCSKVIQTITFLFPSNYFFHDIKNFQWEDDLSSSLRRCFSSTKFVSLES